MGTLEDLLFNYVAFCEWAYQLAHHPYSEKQKLVGYMDLGY